MNSPSSPSSPSSDLTTIAFAIPAEHCNHVQMVFLNGLFRICFMECQVGPDGALLALAPRSAVVLTPDVAMEFFRTFGEFVQNLTTLREAAAASVGPKGTLQ